VGGHNLVEPIAAGVLTLFGPHVAAFRAIAADAIAAGVAQQVENSVELGEAWRRAVEDEELRREVARKARELFTQSRGATERWMKALARLGVGGQEW
jgi:3-deoxy-D-manno-octulosonic-acid transferase